MRRYIVLFVLLLTACGTPATVAPQTSAPNASTAPAAGSTAAGPCAVGDLQAYRSKYDGIIDRWGDAALVAGQAKPANLQTPIANLQKIADDLAALTPPICAQQAHQESLDAMRMSIAGYQTLMAQKEVGQTIRNAIDQLADARAKVGALPGTPAPTPTALPTKTPAPTYTPLPTNTPTSTPVPTATPLPRRGVIASRTQLYDSPASTVPIKTLLKDTPVLVFELQKGRLHIRAGATEGWVSQGSVLIK